MISIFAVTGWLRQVYVYVHVMSVSTLFFFLCVGVSAFVGEGRGKRKNRNSEGGKKCSMCGWYLRIQSEKP